MDLFRHRLKEADSTEPVATHEQLNDALAAVYHELDACQEDINTLIEAYQSGETEPRDYGVRIDALYSKQRQLEKAKLTLQVLIDSKSRYLAKAILAHEDPQKITDGDIL